MVKAIITSMAVGLGRLPLNCVPILSASHVIDFLLLEWLRPWYLTTLVNRLLNVPLLVTIVRGVLPRIIDHRVLP
jgi:hypothetical protein